MASAANVDVIPSLELQWRDVEVGASLDLATAFMSKDSSDWQSRLPWLGGGNPISTLPLYETCPTEGSNFNPECF